MILEFTKNQGGQYETSFVTSDKNVVQLHYESKTPALVQVKCRVDAEMPWTIIKSIPSVPSDFIFDVDVPSDLFVLIESSVEVSQAAVTSD